MSLDRLVGAWTVTMRHVAIPEPITGQQVFEKVLDGAFVLQRSTMQNPLVPEGLALFEAGTVHYFDSRGVTRLFDLEVTDASWSMIRRDADFWQRSSTLFVGDARMEGTGENSHDEGLTWEHDFTMTYARQE